MVCIDMLPFIMLTSACIRVLSTAGASRSKIQDLERRVCFERITDDAPRFVAHPEPQ
jgi:hypothetical protein